MEIVTAKEEDAKEILDIYKYYIENTAITFEYDVPSVEEFKQRIHNTLKKYPYIVLKENNKILGYCYASSFKDRAAYDWSVELSIYLDKNAQGKGYGKILYKEMEERLKAMGIKNMYACIAYTQNDDEYLTNNSPAFHEHLGFNMIGIFNKCGYKFDRWYDMCWMEKMIGEHIPGEAKTVFR